ncbi:MAG: V-type ATP synthase subunit E family protein [Clostridiales bacterium]|nr:V-type ATP synthase subunit E family protein [Clostridiales bacterium]
MPDEAKKLDTFIKEIMNDARSGSESILAAVEADRSCAMAEAEREYRAEADRFVRDGAARARAESGRRISRKLMENKRALHQYRQELSAELTEDVKARLRAYTQTPEYLTRLESLLHEVLEQFDYESVTVYLRPIDLELIRQMGKALPRAGLTFEEGAFELGGLICECPGRRLRSDLTFDLKLEELSSRYSELFALEEVL